MAKVYSLCATDCIYADPTVILYFVDYAITFTASYHCNQNYDSMFQQNINSEPYEQSTPDDAIKWGDTRQKQSTRCLKMLKNLNFKKIVTPFVTSLSTITFFVRERAD